METARLRLRPWQETDAETLHQLWTQRDDPRLPPHRRIDEHGRPDVTDLAEWIRAEGPASGFIVVEALRTEDVLGYCGLVDSGGVRRASRSWPTSCSAAPGGGATRRRPRGRCSTGRSASATDGSGPPSRDWNTASLRVLAELGFHETDRREVDPERGTTLFFRKDL